MMPAPTAGTLYAPSTAPLYAAAMAKVVMVGIQSAREQLRARIEAAVEEGVHTVVAKRGEPQVVMVPMKWYREMRALSGDPTDL